MQKVSVSTHHVSVTKAIKTYAQEKLGNLDKFFDNIQEIVVELDHNDAANENKRNIASVVVRAAGAVIKAKHESKDMYAAIDGLVEKIGTQLKKHKDKIRNPKRTAPKRDLATASEKETTTPVKKLAAKKAPAKKTSLKDPIFVKKPMHPEDAAAVLEEKNVRFLVFKNIENHQICVIYPLENGEFGLVETE